MINQAIIFIFFSSVEGFYWFLGVMQSCTHPVHFQFVLDFFRFLPQYFWISSWKFSRFVWIGWRIWLIFRRHATLHSHRVHFRKKRSEGSQLKLCVTELYEFFISWNLMRIKLTLTFWSSPTITSCMKMSLVIDANILLSHSRAPFFQRLR